MVTSLDNVKVVLVEETNSTQDYALKLVKEDPENAYFVIAEKQTAGRGRKNNIWYSPEGGFWGTLAVPLKELLSEKQLTITHYATALMVQKAISEEYNVYTTIKWPNDIYLTNKKMGGVMVEYITGNTSYLNVGIGININLEYNDYPKELKHSMVSIKDILGYDIPKDNLPEHLIKQAKYYLSCVFKKDFLPVIKEFNEICHNVGQNIIFDQKMNFCNGINEEGELVLIENNKLYTIEIEDSQRLKPLDLSDIPLQR